MSSPKLLMLDEPSLGLSPKLVDEVTGLLGRIRSELGVTVLLVEQNAAVAAGVADRAYVMRRGRIALEEKAEALLWQRGRPERISHVGTGTRSLTVSPKASSSSTRRGLLASSRIEWSPRSLRIWLPIP